MNYETIRTAVEDAGFRARLQPSYAGFAVVSGSTGRMVCERKQAADDAWGTMLWVQHSDAGKWYLGFFSGPIYEVGAPQRLPDFVVALLDRKYWSSGDVTDEARHEFSLRLV